jgi:hypothetical protein
LQIFLAPSPYAFAFKTTHSFCFGLSFFFIFKTLEIISGKYTFKIEIENEYDHMPWGYFASTEEAATITATAVFLDPSGKKVEEFDYNTIEWSFASEYIKTTSDYSFFTSKTGTGETF